MMSLVAYGSSDESENESDYTEESDVKALDSTETVKNVVHDSKESENVTPLGKTSFESKFSDSEDECETCPSTSKTESLLNGIEDGLGNTSRLFSSLPPPKSIKSMSLDLNNSASEKKPRATVKILVPSVSDFDDIEDENEPERKKLKPSSKGSGLLSLLPPPSHVTVKESNRPLVPNSVKKKASSVKGPSVVKIASKTPAQVSKVSLSNGADSGEESGDENSGIDFFSLTEKTEVCAEPVASIDVFANASHFLGTDAGNVAKKVTKENNAVEEQPLSFGPTFQPSPWSKNSGNQQLGAVGHPELDIPLPPSTSEEDSSEGRELKLNDEALQYLCGSRAKRGQQEVQLIDISGEAIMPDPKEWLMKQLTQEKKVKSHSHKKNHGPTSQQRRKHQITYLAYQAKENELELKNQWSQNRLSRKQTQSKYGF